MLRVSKSAVVDVSDSVNVPDVFIGYGLLTKLMKSSEARESFLELFQKDEIVAELVKKEDGGYVTSVVDAVEIPEVRELEGVGFYEEL